MKINFKEIIKLKIFWIITMMAIALTFGILYKIFGSHWLYVSTIISWIPLAAFVIITIAYAWIINPIRKLIEKRKEKKE